MKISLRRALELAVGPANVDAAGHAIADWLESRHGVMASLVRTEVTKGRPAELDQDVPHDRPDTSLRSELMAKLATQREVLLSLCDRVDRLEMRADGLTPIERVQRRWAREAVAKDSSATGGDGPAVPEDREPAAVVEQPTDAELLGLMHQSMRDDLAEVSRLAALQVATEPSVFRVTLNYDVVRFARAVLSRWGSPATPPAPEPPAKALAARPLLEKVARLGDVIGQQTVAQVQQLAEQAASWLRENPPGQPVAIEPRGCPTPGACTCVEPALPLPQQEAPND